MERDAWVPTDDGLWEWRGRRFQHCYNARQRRYGWMDMANGRVWDEAPWEIS